MEQINLRLDEVFSLDDDRIIRRYLDLINATLRTNFYQQDAKANLRVISRLNSCLH